MVQGDPAAQDGDVVMQETDDVDVDPVGDPDRAGFVQVMQGRTTDRQRGEELVSGDSVPASVRTDALPPSHP